MTDVFDQAQEREAQWQQAALAAHTQRVRKGRAVEAAAECVDCGAPIPQARREAVPGVRRCVECQAYFEKESTRGC